jgi:hypothetical protein
MFRFGVARMKKRRVFSYLNAATMLCCGILSVQAQGLARSLHALSLAELCVTEGAVEQSGGKSLKVTASKMRAVARVPVADAAEMRFTYLGPTDVQSALGSGVVRQQLGLKLRALDPCNLVYVMWRMTPGSRLVVQTKSNPAQHASRECGNHGYRTVKPRLAGVLPPLLPGQGHVLAARLMGRELRATVDGRTVWQGELGPETAGSGAVGVRSDNVRMSFALAGATESEATAGALSPCHTDAGE